MKRPRSRIPFNPLDYPLCLASPRQVDALAWQEHIPFAMALVQMLSPRIIVELGVHSGDSYLAFCQAIAESGARAAVYGVDTWRGDAHAGLYGPEVLDRLRRHHDPLYGTFSRLVESTFDDAASYFADCSIDLLHIDGFHEYEVVSHDWKTWKPKLSERGVALFHDTNVRERGFGVWRLWEELAAQYPHFSFTHGHGLGVLAVGPRAAGLLRPLLAVDERDVGTLQSLFFKLGSHITHTAENRSHLAAKATLEAQLAGAEAALAARSSEGDELRAARSALETRLAGAEAELKARSLECAALSSKLEESEAQVRQLRADLAIGATEDARLREELAEKTRQIEALQGRLVEAQERAGRDAEFLAAERTAAQQAQQQVAELLSSTSWRATAPFRRISMRLERLRTGLAGLLATAALLLRHRRLLGRHLGDLRLLRASGLFDASFYRIQYPDVARSGVHPLVHYVLLGAFEGRSPSPEFDTRSYLDANPDVARTRVNPLAHYLRRGAVEGRMPHSSGVPDEVAPTFDAGFYLKRYPDVARAGIDPFQHFVSLGNAEGRIGAPPKLKYSGRFEDMDPARETVLLVAHEASRTGAPILTLNIAQELKKRYNVVTMHLGGGAIACDFARTSNVVVGPIRDGTNEESVGPTIAQLLAACRIKFAIVNSIESRSVLKSLAQGFVPSVVLVHEFASYTRPRHAIRDAAFWASEMVFSAPVVRESAVSESPELATRGLVVIPQGRCLPPASPDMSSSAGEERDRMARAFRPADWPQETVVVLGAGTVSIRKGVDLFIACATRMVRRGYADVCRFVWIGQGYDPDRDTGYSVYLADQVGRAGLDRHVSFVGEVPQMDVAYEQADVFLLSSRLDPLPDVAIGAMAHGLPVVCFDRTTGIADVLKTHGFEDECVAPYLDVEGLVDRLGRFVESRAHRSDVGARLKDMTHELFRMDSYVSQLEDLALHAAERTRQEKDDCLQISAAGRLRLDFLVPDGPHRDQELKDAVRSYVRAWASGIHRRKPCPGFHPGVYFEQGEHAASGGDPFAGYLRAGMPSGPWCSEVITPSDSRAGSDAGGRVALHLHLYYPELAQDILQRLSLNEIRPDLFISVPSEAAFQLVRIPASAYRGIVRDIQITPNRGRDIAPFLSTFGRRLVDNYSFIGHVHTKKSLVLGDAAFGQRWFTFLLENLIGGKHRMADCILRRMAEDPTIGLVFPDDPYVVDWSANRELAQCLADRLGLTKLPEFHINFPVGTMFWARAQAIAPLVDLNLEWNDFPSEPLPYDGTILHAIERLLPFVAEHAGLRYAVTNVPDVTR